MSSNEESGGSKFFAGLFMIYILGTGITFPYFSYTIIRDKGFMTYMIGGELLATFQAALWPYYMIQYFTSKEHIANHSEHTTNSLSNSELKVIQYVEVISINDQKDRELFENWNRNIQLSFKYMINREGIPGKKAYKKEVEYFRKSEVFARQINSNMLVKIEASLGIQWDTNILYIRKYIKKSIDVLGKPEEAKKLESGFAKFRECVGRWSQYYAQHQEIFTNGYPQE